MGDFLFEAKRCPATGEPCQILEDEITGSSFEANLRFTLGTACREGMRVAKMTQTEQIECGLEYGAQLEAERASRAAAKEAGVYYA